MLLEVDKTFFVIGLRPGSIFIGYLNLILDLVLAVLLIRGIIQCMVPPISRLAEIAYIIYIIVFSTVLLFVLINLSFVILLLTGLHLSKPRLILAYLSCSYVYIVLAVIWCILMAILELPDTYYYVINLSYIGASIYFYIVIRSYCWRLSDRILANDKYRAGIQNLSDELSIYT